MQRVGMIAVQRKRLLAAKLGFEVTAGAHVGDSGFAEGGE